MRARPRLPNRIRIGAAPTHQASLNATLNGTKDGIGFAKTTDIGAKALNFNLASRAIPQTNLLGKAAAKAGPLGAIGLASGAVSMVNDARAGDGKQFAKDTLSEGLAAGAVFAPPPADVICGAASLGVAAYQNIGVIHDGVNQAASWGKDAAKSAGSAISSGWHSLTSGW